MSVHVGASKHAGDRTGVMAGRKEASAQAHRVRADADDAGAERCKAHRLPLAKPQRIADRPPPASEHLCEKPMKLLDRALPPKRRLPKLFADGTQQ